MRYLLLLYLFLVGPVAWSAPATVETISNQRLINGSHVSNPDGIISAEASAKIDRLLTALEQNTGPQVAVVAIESIGQNDIFTFAQQLFVAWGIGHKGRDDGLLVLLVKDQRTVRMHTGYGLEGTLPDVVCKRIQRDYMVPAFKEGRYGDGLLAGLTAVAKVLSDPASAQTLTPSATGQDTPRWIVFRDVSGVVGAIIVFIAFGIKNLLGHFSTTSEAMDGVPAVMRWNRKQWLMSFVVIPALIVVGYDMMPVRSPILMCCGTLYGYFVLTAALQAWRQQQAITGLFEKGNYYAIGTLIGNEQSFWARMAFLLPVPFLFYFFFHLSRKAHYRNHPRTCPKCKGPMRKLSEQEEDAFLSKAQQMEETLHSADHDVWQCGACEATTSWTYPGTESKYTKCPACKSVAYFEESDRTLVSPTYSASGKGESVHACAFCGNRKTKTYSISKLVESSTSSIGSSSSSSSSSSSGGSDWGGGNSGGGGASSSW